MLFEETHSRQVTERFSARDLPALETQPEETQGTGKIHSQIFLVDRQNVSKCPRTALVKRIEGGRLHASNHQHRHANSVSRASIEFQSSSGLDDRFESMLAIDQILILIEDDRFPVELPLFAQHRHSVLLGLGTGQRPVPLVLRRKPFMGQLRVEVDNGSRQSRTLRAWNVNKDDT